MIPWTYGNVRLTKRLSSSQWKPASRKPPVNAVICFVKKDQGAKHPRPIIISTKPGEGTDTQNKTPREMCWRVGESCIRAKEPPLFSSASFSFVVIVCITQQYKGLITVGRLSPLEPQFLTSYKSNVPQTSEPFGGAATWGGVQENRHGAVLQQEDKSPFWPPFFVFPSLSPFLEWPNQWSAAVNAAMFISLLFSTKTPRIVKAACAKMKT